MPRVQIITDPRRKFKYAQLLLLAELLPNIVTEALCPHKDNAMDTRELENKAVKVEVYTPEIYINAPALSIRIEAGHNAYRDDKGEESLVQDIIKGIKPIMKDIFPELEEKKKNIFIKLTLTDSAFKYL